MMRVGERAMQGLQEALEDRFEAPRASSKVALADRLVLLQPAGIDELPEHVRDKARVIYQSVTGVAARDGVVSAER